MLFKNCHRRIFRDKQVLCASSAIAFASVCASSSIVYANVLYTSMNGTPSSYFTFYGTDPSDTFAAGAETGNGDDYNVGNLSFTLTGFSFYGGDTDPNQVAAGGSLDQYVVTLEFYNLAGNRVAAVQLPDSKIVSVPATPYLLGRVGL